MASNNNNNGNNNPYGNNPYHNNNNNGNNTPYGNNPYHHHNNNNNNNNISNNSQRQHPQRPLQQQNYQRQGQPQPQPQRQRQQPQRQGQPQQRQQHQQGPQYPSTYSGAPSPWQRPTAIAISTTQNNNSNSNSHHNPPNQSVNQHVENPYGNNRALNPNQPPRTTMTTSLPSSYSSSRPTANLASGGSVTQQPSHHHHHHPPLQHPSSIGGGGTPAPPATNGTVVIGGGISNNYNPVRNTTIASTNHSSTNNGTIQIPQQQQQPQMTVATTTATASTNTDTIALQEQIKALKQELDTKEEVNFDLNATIVTMQAEMNVTIRQTEQTAKEETSRLQHELRLAQQHAHRAQQQVANLKKQQQLQQPLPSSAVAAATTAAAPFSNRLLGVETTTRNVTGGVTKPNNAPYNHNTHNTDNNNNNNNNMQLETSSIPSVIVTRGGNNNNNNSRSENRNTINNNNSRRQSAPANLSQSKTLTSPPFPEPQPSQGLEPQDDEGGAHIWDNNDNDTTAITTKNHNQRISKDNREDDHMDQSESSSSSTSELYTVEPFTMSSGQVLARHLVQLFCTTTTTITLDSLSGSSSSLLTVLLGIATSTTGGGGVDTYHYLPPTRKGRRLIPSAGTGAGAASSIVWNESDVIWYIVQTTVMQLKRWQHSTVQDNQHSNNNKIGDSNNSNKSEPPIIDPPHNSNHPSSATASLSTTTAMEIEDIRTTNATTTSSSSISGSVEQCLTILHHALTISVTGRSEVVDYFSQKQQNNQQQQQQGQQQQGHAILETHASAVTTTANLSGRNRRRYQTRLRFVVTDESDSEEDENDIEKLDDPKEPIHITVPDKTALSATVRDMQSPLISQQPSRTSIEGGESNFPATMTDTWSTRHNWAEQLVTGLLDVLLEAISLPSTSTSTKTIVSPAMMLLSSQSLSTLLSTISAPSPSSIKGGSNSDIWWRICGTPVTQALYRSMSQLLHLLSASSSSASAPQPLDGSVVANRTRSTFSHPPPGRGGHIQQQEQQRRRRRRREQHLPFRRVLYPSASTEAKNAVAPCSEDEAKQHSQMVTSLLALLQRLLYVTSPGCIRTWWMAPETSHSDNPSLSKKRHVTTRQTAPTTDGDTNGQYLVSFGLDLLEQEWDITAETPFWYREAIHLLRYIASIPFSLEDSPDTAAAATTVEDGHTTEPSIRVLRTRRRPATRIGDDGQEEVDFDEEGNVVPPPFLGNAIDVAIHQLHRLVILEPCFSNRQVTNHHHMFLTSCMESWIRFLHQIFLYVQKQQQQHQGEEEEGHGKTISFRSLVEDCQDYYTSAYAQILTTPDDNVSDEDKDRKPKTATWRVTNDIKHMMRLQLEELAMDEEEYEEIHGVSL